MSNAIMACRCSRCNRRLKSAEAIQVGMGATCLRKATGKTIKQYLKEVAQDALEAGDETEPE